MFELLSSEAYPDLPDTVRWKARHLLRHYPRTQDMKLAALALPGWFATPLDQEAAPEDEPGQRFAPLRVVEPGQRIMNWWCDQAALHCSHWRTNMSYSTFSEAGETKVPSDIVAALHLKAGTQLAWTILSDGTVIVRGKWRKLTDLAGVVKRPAGTRASLDQMNPEL